MVVQQAMAVRAMLSAQPPVLRKSDFFPYMVEVLESRAKKSDFLKSDFFSVYGFMVGLSIYPYHLSICCTFDRRAMVDEPTENLP